MAKNTASKNLLGSVYLDSADRDDDAEHCTRMTYTAHLDGTLTGAVDESILLFVPQTDITITAVRLVPSLGISKGGTLPIITLVQADLAGGSQTTISTVADLTAADLTAVTATSGTVSAGSVTKNVGVWLKFAKQSTGAVVGNTSMTILVDYDLAN